MQTQYFFRNNIHHKPAPLKRKSNWTPPPSDNLTLVEFFTRIEQELTSINTPCRKTYCNLTLQEKTALNNLKNKQSIVIKLCDKGGGICIMNTRDYLSKIHTHLQDHNTYKPLTHNPTSSIANDACTLMEYIHSQLIIARLLWNFYCLLRILPYCLSSMDFLKFTRQNALSTLLFLGLMVQMTIPLPASPISANP